MGYDNCFNANRRTLNYQRVNMSQCTFPFQAIPRNDQNVSPTNQKTAGTKLDRAS